MTSKPVVGGGGNPPAVSPVHATGNLKSIAPGILEGAISFPVRGDIVFRMERRDHDSYGGEVAFLCTKDASRGGADLALIKASLDDAGPDYWHGHIPVEGYWFRVHGLRVAGAMRIQLFDDAKQPPAALELVA